MVLCVASVRAVDPYVVLLKLHNPNRIHLHLVREYRAHIGDSRFAVLQNRESGLVQHRPDIDAKSCDWSFALYLTTYRKLATAYERLNYTNQWANGFSWMSPQFSILAPVLLFRAGLLKGSCNELVYSRTATNIWALESDAYFSGNSESAFFAPLATSRADLLSTGFAATLPQRWWGFDLSTGRIVPGKVDLPEFQCGRMKLKQHCTGVHCSFLDELRGCPQPTAAALVMRLVIVERYSPALLDLVEKAIQDGNGMIGEGLASSLCYQHDGCKSEDWQEVFARRYKSPFFTWNPSPAQLSPQTCEEQRNMWFHPVRALKVPSDAASGLKWKRVDNATKLMAGTELKNEKLADALRAKKPTQNGELEFTPDELSTFDVRRLRVDHSIHAGRAYFQPVGAVPHNVCSRVVRHIPRAIRVASRRQWYKWHRKGKRQAPEGARDATFDAMVMIMLPILLVMLVVVMVVLAVACFGRLEGNEDESASTDALLSER